MSMRERGDANTRRMGQRPVGLDGTRRRSARPHQLRAHQTVARVNPVSDSAPRDGDFPYDVALSFAGEQRPYVLRVAAALRRRGVRTFYDDYEKPEMWGKDLYEHL